MIISCVYPSRGRAKKCKENIIEWTKKCSASVEIIVATDSTDPAQPEYAKELYFPYLIHDNKSVVEATNRAASVSSGKILVYMSDDFKCPENWGGLIIDQFYQRGDFTKKPILLKVDDCLQRFETEVCTIPIINRPLYEKLGYFWHPAYLSMHVDEDIYHTCKKIGALKLAPQIKFPHHHYSIGKAPVDETYRRSEANWDQGKATFARRKAEGFPV